MTTKREAPARPGDRRRRPDGGGRNSGRRPADAQPARRGRSAGKTAPPPPHDARAPRTGPQLAVASRSTGRPVPPKNASQAKARAKARKAKAPKVVRAPLRERLLIRLASVDLRPRTLAAKVPFVVLIIGALALGLGITLWLSTDAAERSYQLGNIRTANKALMQQKEALERDVLQAEAAPALAEAARELGMIPTRDTAHLVQDPVGNWVVVGSPKPAEGAPPPPLNTKLPEEQPARPASPAQPAEVPVRVPLGSGVPASPLIPGAVPGTVGGTVPGTAPLGPEAPLHIPEPVTVPPPNVIGIPPQPVPAAPAPGAAPLGPSATFDPFAPPPAAVFPGGPR